MAEAALDIGFMSVEEYLARENDGDWKHEFVNGAVYAMVGTSDRHNLIAGELYAALLAHLPPRCQPFVIDLKVQIRRGRDVRFYYPDVFVSCGASDRATYTREDPVLVAEVLSPSTDRIDRGEKFEAYKAIPSLEEYLLIAQDQPKVELFRRRTGFEHESFGPGDLVHLESVELALPVAALYRRITF